MDAVEFLYEKNRMMLNDAEAYKQIKNICSNEGLVEYIEQWSKEHPPKTRAQDLFEKYPNAPKNIYDFPSVCAAALGYRDFCEIGYGDINCKDCWNEPV